MGRSHSEPSRSEKSHDYGVILLGWAELSSELIWSQELPITRAGGIVDLSKQVVEGVCVPQWQPNSQIQMSLAWHSAHGQRVSHGGGYVSFERLGRWSRQWKLAEEGE